MTWTLCTAADERYARSLAQLLLSVERVCPRARVIAFDLGGMRRALGGRFSWVQFRDPPPLPAITRLRERHRNTNGFKPFLLEVTLREAEGPVLWLDSACVLLGAPPLDEIRRIGVYAPYGGSASVAERTHPAARVEGLDRVRMRASGVVGFDPASEVAQWVLAAWKEGCSSPNLLAPPGATLDNHRFDQSVLNLVLLREGPFGRVMDRLNEDALDISSAAPIPWLRSRNKVHPRLPLASDPLVRAFFRVRRGFDVAWLRWRASRARIQGRTACGTSPPSPELRVQE